MEITDEILKEINKFTRRDFSADELYVFDVVLCDNRTDRDNERFSLESLEKMKELFIGKTGIFDHSMRGEKQTARIFSASLSTDNEICVENEEPYTQLKASCYMVRTESNKDLITEIDGGIKKEVSVSCSCRSHICSVCKREHLSAGCSHVKGKYYGTKKCCVILDDVYDAYEWSFVAVPAQKAAGVVKRFREAAREEMDDDYKDRLIEECAQEVKSDIIRLSFLSMDEISQKALEISVETMNLSELCALKRSLLNKYKNKGRPQLAAAAESRNSKYKV